jgi:CRISPR-associated protein (TIGR02584 family)
VDRTPVVVEGVNRAKRLATSSVAEGETRGTPRRIVALCLAGLSPAVVTEALYALAMRRPRILPGGLHIITTAEGYAAVAATLLGPSGALDRLRTEYRLPPTAFPCPPQNVHVLVDARGRPLHDIVTSADSEAVGEQLGTIVRRLGATPGTSLYCSIAGGRKTMGALLAMALQLHGGPDDHLFHVLVSAPWERIPSFYFPTRRPLLLQGPGGCLDARRAKVTLAELPLVRLGPAVRRLGLSGHKLARLAQEIEAEATGGLRLDGLALERNHRRVRVGEARITLPAQQFALYELYALARLRCRRRACAAGGRCRDCQLADDEVHERQADLLRLYRALRPASAGHHLEKGPAAQDLNAFREWLEQTRSRLNRALRDALGGPGPRVDAYLIRDAGAIGGDKRCRGIGLEPGLIRFVEAEG